MPIKVTVTRTAKRKDGNSIGTVRKSTNVRVSNSRVTVVGSRSVTRPGKENVRVSKKS